MTRQEIEAAIPHRAPMLLLDEIVQQADDRLVCRKTFGEDEFFVQGHYPGFPLVPGVILCECAMQAGAVLLSQMVENADGVPVVTRVNDVRFRRMVRPGDTIEIDVRFKERLASAFFLDARVNCEGKVAARLEFACTLTEVDKD
jgi:3-hydroxyacyl-[acyl-carrier-protein] dehydratase